MARQEVTNKFLRDCAASKAREKDGKKPYGGPYPQRKQGQIPDGPWVWMHDMEKWGRDVRKDIQALERKLRMAKGDPGDPPPPPPDDLES